MSQKYEHRVDYLKNHKNDKGRHHQKELKPYSRKNKLGQMKKEEKEFHEKIEKSEYTWL